MPITDKIPTETESPISDNEQMLKMPLRVFSVTSTGQIRNDFQCFES